jgi:hypothetical protein
LLPLRPLLRPTIPRRLETVRQLNTAGVSILAGTDLGNPLLVPNTRKIAAVVLNGRYFDRRALDALLARAEANARRQ